MGILRDYQLDALGRMHNGCILNGGVGSGKSRTSIAYYYIRQGGSVEPFTKLKKPVKDLYIITTARKRDTHEWESDMGPFVLSSTNPKSQAKVTVDSWNNITKYADVRDAFFIFDEQRVVGWGTWSKTFVKIAQANEWILCSATPGDCWADYAPVFIANGYFKNITDFRNRHVVYKRFTKYPQIDKYIDTGRLIRLRKCVLIDMDFQRTVVYHPLDIYTEYDRDQYKLVQTTRWNIWDDRPMRSASELCQGLRKVVNSDSRKVDALLDLLIEHPKAIVFYNYDYELDILKNAHYCFGTEVAEWNGHAHQPIPEGDRWVYLVQYTAGCEGWNCIKTDTIIFYSLSYSYKQMEQARGRTDRMNTPYQDLYYYYLKTHAKIDLGIARALKDKKNFNEGKFVMSF